MIFARELAAFLSPPLRLRAPVERWVQIQVWSGRRFWVRAGEEPRHYGRAIAEQWLAVGSVP